MAIMTNPITIKMQRVYDPDEEGTDGFRILVDRFWPRGIKKADLPYDLWAKDITPSSTLRELFHEDPEKNWDIFKEKYTSELQASDSFKALIQQIKAKNIQHITLLYGFRNKEKNHALIIKEELEAGLSKND